MRQFIEIKKNHLARNRFVEANHECEKLFGPKRGEAAECCAGTFAASSAVLPAEVLPMPQQHCTLGFLSHCREKHKADPPQISGRG